MAIICPAGHEHVVKAGKTRTRAGLIQRYKCQDCGRIFHRRPRQEY